MGLILCLKNDLLSYNTFVLAVDIPEQSIQVIDDSEASSDDDDKGRAHNGRKHRPPTIEEARVALEKMDAVIRTRRQSGAGYCYADLDRVTSDRCVAISACLRHFLGSRRGKFIGASITAAEGQGRGHTYARRVRKWTRRFMESGEIPKSIHGWWNISALEDEDVSHSIKVHLQSVGKYASAADIVKFLCDPAVRADLGLEKSISVRTAQRWFYREGYRWRAEPKGQYVDGHERSDVVMYRQTKFIPLWQSLERRMVIYNENGVPDPERPMNKKWFETEIVVWFHDESIFRAYDRRMVRWVYIGEHPTPFKKGEGASMMIADFVSAKYGLLRGADQ